MSLLYRKSSIALNGNFAMAKIVMRKKSTAFIPAIAGVLGAIAMQSPSLALPPLSAAYNFDEAAGSALTDRSGNNHPGTLTNGPSWTAGKYSGGLAFDGTNDYVTMGDVAQADSRTAFTVSAWVKFKTAGGGANEVHLVDKSGCSGSTDGGPWELGVSLTRAHKAEFLIYPQGGTPAAFIFSGASSTSVDDGNWHFIAGRYDGTDISIWVDGVQENSTRAAGLAMSNSGYRFELGGYCNGYPYPFNGSLDDVRLYAGALTQAELQADMATPVGGPSTTPPDTTAPNVAVVAPASGATVSGTTTVSATASDNVAVALVQFLLDGAPLGEPKLSAPYTLAWNTTAASNGNHTLSAIARDAAGNTKTAASVSVVVSNSVTPPADVTAPTTPTNLASGNVTTTSIAFSWSASSDNVAVAGYRVFRNGQQIATVTSPSYTNTGLAAGTTYSYKVAAFDAGGNTSAQSASLSVTTTALPVADTTPPSIPSGLAASNVTQTQARISWAPSSDNVAVTGYRVFRNGVQVATASAANFTDTALTANTAYVYTVAAFDAAGNVSQQSTALAVTTAAGGGVSYSTDFNLTENPISEGGVWHRANNEWTNVRTVGGNAFGTNGVTNGYDDSYALLSGFGPDQTVEAVVYRNQSLIPGSTHEVELLLRFSDDAGNARGYECLFNWYGGFQVVRWNGRIGDVEPLRLTEEGYFGRPLVTGDVIKATIVGNVIRIYINGVQMGKAVDSTFTTGQPGISFFIRPDGSPQLLGLGRVTATSPTAQ
jgi:chitodextrinase